MTNFQCALIVASLLLIAGGVQNDNFEKRFYKLMAAIIFVGAVALTLN